MAQFIGSQEIYVAINNLQISMTFSSDLIHKYLIPHFSQYVKIGGKKSIK